MTNWRGRALVVAGVAQLVMSVLLLLMASTRPGLAWRSFVVLSALPLAIVVWESRRRGS
jgi:hypothetical protein